MRNVKKDSLTLFSKLGITIAAISTFSLLSGCSDDSQLPMDDSWAMGPYTAVTIEDTGPNNDFDLIYPAELESDGMLNPIITWGNGATTLPSWYDDFLPRFASYGFVVIAAHDRFVSGNSMVDGIDWLVEQNRDPSSEFYQLLDENKVAAVGYSLGSLAAFNIANDARLTTTVHISGGAGGNDSVQNLWQPTAFFCDENFTAVNCQPDFDLSPVPVFYGVFKDTGHVGTITSLQAAGATTGWLRWRLLDDDSKRALFVGDDCTLCTNDSWIVQQKGLDSLD